MNRAQRRAAGKKTVFEEISLSGDALRSASAGIIAAMNEAQTLKRFTVGETIAATAWALGCALAQAGAILRPGQPIEQSLPPVLTGYNDKRKEMARAHVRDPAQEE